MGFKVNAYGRNLEGIMDSWRYYTEHFPDLQFELWRMEQDSYGNNYVMIQRADGVRGRPAKITFLELVMKSEAEKGEEQVAAAAIR